MHTELLFKSPAFLLFAFKLVYFFVAFLNRVVQYITLI